MRPAITHLLYLHGFRSSPRSSKALQVAGRVARDHPNVVWCCPSLPASPAEAAHLIEAAVADWPHDHMAVVGSSLGGFYARWLALRKGCRAALLNPAPFPQRDLARYIGDHPVWHNPEERIYFQPHYIGELETLAADIHRRQTLPTRPDDLFAIIARGDEVLDADEMLAFCQGGSIRLLPGGDHAISDFDAHIDALFGFLNLTR